MLNRNMALQVFTIVWISLPHITKETSLMTSQTTRLSPNGIVTSSPLSTTVTGNSNAEGTTTVGLLSSRTTTESLTKDSINNSTSWGGVSRRASVLPTLWTTTGSNPTTVLDSIVPIDATGNSLTMLAFGVMSFILILIVVMVILVTAVNLRGKCNATKDEGKKSGDSVVSESNITINGEKESITLVSMKTINTETDTDSPRISSIHSTTVDDDH
ncbi:endothelial cell-specific chemotaxis regulator isoform X2 [Amia ocellicauda]|uniref:endothelial cell-specific chemotaxis regulator isoform X2 n=1 Tax=Amia ocellicauda TaxID=2972642 RepID=UPI003463AC5F